MSYPPIRSEKAKGKQKAVEPGLLADTNITQNNAKPEDPSRNLVVRFTDGSADLVVTVKEQDTVWDVKQNVRQLKPELKDRRLRLINSGRLLTDGTFLYSWLVSLEERQKRATKDSKGPQPEHAVASTTWLHCSVGQKLESGEDEKEEGKAQSGQLQPLRGFDQLASVGFSEEDIANIRRQFHSQNLLNYPSEDFDEENDEHARALEEQWIDSIDNVGSASLSQSSSSSSLLLQGVLMGFFFPLIPFFFFWKQKPPVFWQDGTQFDPPENIIFTQGTEMGIVVGFLINVLFGMWRFLLDSS